MASPLLRSSAAILRRSNPRAWTFPRRPGQSSVEGTRFHSAGAGVVVEPKAGCVCMGADLKKLAANARQMRETVAIMQEQEERFQRHEEFQKKLSYVLVPSAIAFFIFGPEKKEKASSE